MPHIFIYTRLYIYTPPAGSLTFPRLCGQTPKILVKWEQPWVSLENPGYSLNLPAEVKLIEFLCMLNNPGGHPVFFVQFRSIAMFCWHFLDVLLGKVQVRGRTRDLLVLNPWFARENPWFHWKTPDLWNTFIFHTRAKPVIYPCNP